MEKLVLRGIMYGADKIPDSWFDKVPGGYYKAEKEAEKRQKQQGAAKSTTDLQMPHHSSRRNKSRRRRHSDEYEDRRPRYDEDPYAGQRPGYGSDRQRRYERRRSSYDGGDDYDPYYDDYGRGYDRRGRYDDRYNDRYAYNDGYGATGPRGQDYGPGNVRFEPPPMGDHRSSYSATGPPGGSQYAPPVDPATAAAAGAGAAAAAHMNNQASRGSSGGTGGYVPYSNIYGPTATQPQGSRHPFSPPPDSSTGSVQPNGMNQLAAPFSPPSSTAPGANAYNQPPPSGYGPGPMYEDPYNDPYFDDRRPPAGYGYDYGDRPHSPPRRRRQSPPYDDDSYASPPRRSRSERRRPSDKPPHAKSRGKSLQRLTKNFDTSQRGVGYGGVGALAGGLVGSEIGKGPIPAVIGAALGGIGANAFGARERFVSDPRANDKRGEQSLRLPPPSSHPSRRPLEKSMG